VRDPAVVRDGLAACRAALADSGVLLVQDATLPSVTTLVTGTPVRGSWWAHEQAHSIFDVLEALAKDVAAAKLLLRKRTLIDRRLHPDLAAVGGERAPWQIDGLTDDALAMLVAVDEAGGAQRVDELATTGPSSAANVVRDLERRLLVASHEIHTESGRHTKVLQCWSGWAAAVGCAVAPDPREARTRFERSLAPVLATAGVGRSPFPWPPEV
jgi:hypothetical protein